jgi:hypothetical protein
MTKSKPKLSIGMAFSLAFITIFAFSLVISFTPLLDSETIQYQKAYYESDKTIFATYFYWYKANGNISNAQQIMREVGPNEIADINKSLQKLPSGWPGPTTVEGIVSFNATGNGKNYKNSITRAPLGFAPSYDSKGEVIGELPRSAPINNDDKNGMLYNLSSFIDWNNPAWHEWEIRCMMRAGIDVLMPVYWWEGPVYTDDTHWSRQGLFTLNDSITALRAKVDLERQNGGKYRVEDIPKIAMFYDTTLLKMMWARNVTSNPESIYYQNWTKAFDGPGADLENSYWKHEFYLRIEEFFDVIIKNPNLFVSNITINGRVEESCVVWLYSASWVDNVGSSVFNYAKEKFKEKFGKNLVFVGERQWNSAGIDGICPWGGSIEMRPAQYSKIPVGALGPGYFNIGAIEVQPAIYKNRTIEQFKNELKDTARTGATWIHIETWNELLEGTDICWTYQNGFDRIDAVREFADWYHSLSSTDMYLLRLNLPLIITPFLSFVLLAVAAYIIQKKK